TLDSTFNSGHGVAGQVFSMDIQDDGKILIGGYFSAYDDIPAANIVRINSNGSIDPDFSSLGASFTVFSVKSRPDGFIYVGGLFTSFDHQLRKAFARVKSNGTVDDTFAPVIERSGNLNLNPEVYCMTFTADPKKGNQSSLIIGGQFSGVNGINRISIVRFLLPIATPFDFDGDGKTDASIFRPAD